MVIAVLKFLSWWFSGRAPWEKPTVFVLYKRTYFDGIYKTYGVSYISLLHNCSIRNGIVQDSGPTRQAKEFIKQEAMMGRMWGKA